jgi:hypothetical protein
MVSAWCHVCCTRHEPERRCPGELLATGAERFGWRVKVRTHYGVEVIGVLVAPVDERWRARILTFPNILWMIPGGGGSIKFLGGSPAEAELEAIAFIREHCRLRGFGIVEESARPVSGKLDHEQTPESASSDAVRAAQRKLRALPVRFGVNGLATEGIVGDLSEGGVFIATESTLTVGTPLSMELEIEGCKIPLRGVVAWKRDRAGTGRPAGMGVDLLDPPALFMSLVRDMP